MSTRAELISRLHHDPRDFEATRQLQMLDADPGRTGPRDDRRSDALVLSGLSGIGRMRSRWAHRKEPTEPV